MSTDLSRDELPPALTSRIEGELQPDEKLVWLGRPSPWRGCVGSLFLSVFGLVFAGFALVWILVTGGLAVLVGAAGANQPGAGAAALFPGCFALFGLPFLLVGALLAAAPLWARYAAGRTCYAITNRRAITWEPAPFGAWQVRSYTARNLRDLSRVERANGWGDLIFQQYQTHDAQGHYSTTRLGFFGVPNVHEVERLLRQTLLTPPGQ